MNFPLCLEAGTQSEDAVVRIQGLKEKTKINNFILSACFYLVTYLVFIVAKSRKNESINKRRLDKWNYCCNQNLSDQKNFASTKTLKQDQDYI